MILHRFCSRKEFEAYMSGSGLLNTVDHGAVRGYDATTAVGFCFFDDDPDIAVHRLAGIVDLDVCLTVECSHVDVRLCSGRYTNWVRPGIREGSIHLKEFCATQYDNSSFRYISHTDKYSSYAPNASLLRELFPGVF